MLLQPAQRFPTATLHQRLKHDAKSLQLELTVEHARKQSPLHWQLFFLRLTNLSRASFCQKQTLANHPDPSNGSTNLFLIDTDMARKE